MYSSWVVWCKSKAYLLVQELDTLGFDSYMNCYRVENKMESLFDLYSPSYLLDYHPLDKYMPFLDGKFFVSKFLLVAYSDVHVF